MVRVVLLKVNKLIDFSALNVSNIEYFYLFLSFVEGIDIFHKAEMTNNFRF